MVSPRRALLFENGAALGVFHAGGGGDGDRYRAGRSVVVMEPSGASFTHLRQDGGCHRQLSKFCRRDLVPHVAAVARFRNAHSPRPYICQRLHTQQEGGSNRSSRRRRAPSRLAQWPVAAATITTTTIAAAAAAAAAAARRNAGASAHPANPSSCCTTRADGTVEVCAVGGNARLTLSASRTIAEVDYAVAVPTGSGGPADTGSRGGVLDLESAEAVKPRSANDDRAGRAWITRQFLVGSSSCDVPPEFSHALAVALRASSPPAADAVEGKGDVEGVGAPVEGMEGGGRKGLVASELPRPESSPEHPSWETVQASSPVFFDGGLHLAPLGYGNLPRRTRNTAPAAASCLLSVDVMKLAEGRDFAGGLAAVVETTGGCTYRIVVGGEAGGRRDSINVHVVVHADGTEVWLEGDFVRLVRPSSSATAAPHDPPMMRNGERERERLLHTSAASTIRFGVPTPAPLTAPPPPSSDQAADTSAASSPGGWTSMSLGEITTRALALRRQFMALGTQAAGRDGGSSSSRPVQQHPEVKIRPSTLVAPGESAAATLGSPPVGLSRTVRGAKPSYTLTRRLQAPSLLSGTPVEGARAKGTVAPRATITPTGATVIVESVDRGGASFVAFSDGRARGAFADRTIVTLGAPFSYLPLPQGVGTMGRAAAPCGAVPRSGCEEDEEDREIECIRPDGTVVRLTERSLGPPRGRFGASAGGPHGRSSCDGGRRHAFGPTAAASAAAAMHPGRGGFTRAVAVGDSDLRPYIVAVLRFAAWAATPPEERQAAAEREAAGRLVAAAEAERNRRFVDLGRVAKLSTTSPRDVMRKAGAPQMKIRSSSGAGDPTRGLDDDFRFAGCVGALACGWRCEERKAAGDSLLQGAENVILGGDGKENLSRSSSLFAEMKQGVAGRGRGAERGR